MREDMFKVIVERPRWGSRSRNVKLRYLKEDDGRIRISGKRLAYEQGGTKCLNENLAPLRRYLLKQRGRKWDDVFSDICARLDTGSTVKMHVREHLDDFVIRKVRLDADGMYWAVSRWGAPQKPDQWYPNLYVCPYDGRLKESEKLRQKLGLKKRRYHTWRDRLNQKSDDLVRLGRLEFLVRLKGSWFLLITDTEPLSGYVSEVDIYETIRDGLRSPEKTWNVLTKKQLSKKELKKHGLRNGGDYE